MATFPIDVTVDPRQAEAGLRRVRGALNRTDSAAARVGRSLLRVFGAAIAGFAGVNAVRIIANFEQQLAGVRAVTGATEQQFASLRAEARRLGGTTEFTATQVASAMGFLGRAGFEANQVLASTEGVLTLATAGALDLAQAADIASNVLTGFNLQVTELGRVNDVLAATASSTNTTVESLGRSFSLIAPSAAALGIEVETVAAAVGVLGNAGIQGTRAATGLRAAFRGLTVETGPASEVLAELGLNLADLDPQVNGLIEPFRRLAQAGISYAQAQRLFGDEGVAAFFALSGNTRQLAELEDQFRNSSGAAAEMARIMRDQLGGSIKELDSAARDVVQALGEAGITSAARTLIELATSGLRAVATQADTLLAVLRGIGVYLALTMIPLIIRLALHMRRLALAHPFTAILLGLTILGSALYEHRDAVTDFVRGVAFSIAGSIDSALTFIQMIFNEVRSGFDTLLDNIVDGLGRRLNPVILQYNRLLERLPQAAQDAAGGPIDFIFADRTPTDPNISPVRTDATDFVRRFFGPPRLPRGHRGGSLVEGALPSLPPLGSDSSTAGAGGTAQEGPTYEELFANLERERDLIRLTTEERERAIAVFQIQDQLERDLTETERVRVENLVRESQVLRIRHGILEDLRDPGQALVEELGQINEILAGVVPGLELTNEQLEILRDRVTDITIELGDADFLTILDDRLNETFGTIDNLSATSADRVVKLVGQVSDGIGRGIANMILGINSFGDAVRTVAVTALQTLISQLIAAVVQALILKAVFTLLGIGPGGGSLGSLFVQALIGRQGGLVANLPQRYQAGGLVRGAGGQTEDLVPAFLSPQEFVVNARSTAENREDLEAINRGGRARRRNVTFNQYITTPDADSFRESRRQIARDATALGRRIEREDR